jgi:hypothetical protein
MKLHEIVPQGWRIHGIALRPKDPNPFTVFLAPIGRSYLSVHATARTLCEALETVCREVRTHSITLPSGPA